MVRRENPLESPAQETAGARFVRQAPAVGGGRPSLLFSVNDHNISTSRLPHVRPTPRSRPRRPPSPELRPVQSVTTFPPILHRPQWTYLPLHYVFPQTYGCFLRAHSQGCNPWLRSKSICGESLAHTAESLLLFNHLHFCPAYKRNCQHFGKSSVAPAMCQAMF